MCKLFLNRNPAFIFRMSTTASVDKQLLIFLVSVATLIWLFVIKPKRVNLAFHRLVSEAGFAFCSCATFMFFGGASFFIIGLFVRPLYVFRGATFFIGGLFVKPYTF
jgi:hypothetical protein